VAAPNDTTTMPSETTRTFDDDSDNSTATDHPSASQAILRLLRDGDPPHSVSGAIDAVTDAHDHLSYLDVLEAAVGLITDGEVYVSGDKLVRVSTDGGAVVDQLTDADGHPLSLHGDDLTRFQLDLLYALAASPGTHGLGLHDRLEADYETAVNHSRLYQNLNSLVEQGLVTKTSRDGRTNEYRLSGRGERVVRADLQRRHAQAAALLGTGDGAGETAQTDGGRPERPPIDGTPACQWPMPTGAPDWGGDR